MAVKNLKSIGNTGNIKPIPIYSPIPPVSESDYLFKIITSDSVEISLEDLVVKGTVTDGATDTIGSFELQILDPDKTIYNQFDTFDDLVMYADYGEPITLRFRGKIERRGYQDIYTVISGRSLGMIFVEKPIIYSSEGKKNKSDILKEIIANNFSEYSINVDNIEEDTNQLDVNYYEIPFTQIIETICGSTYDFYLDHSYNAHYFEKGSRLNQTEAISELVNHIETTDNAYDSEETYSKVRVYGSQIENIPLISTSTEDTTLTKGVSKVKKIDNNSATTTTEVDDYLDSQVQIVSEIPKVGSHRSILLPSIQPGEKLFVVIPREGVDPGYYTINSYTHEFDLNAANDRTTVVNLVKRRQQISEIMKNRINFENYISENPNPNNLDFSLIVQFNTDTGTHDDTEINEGYLKLQQGENVGSWISQDYTLPQDVSNFELRWTGDNLVGDYQVSSSQLWYSLDGGTTFKPAILGGETYLISTDGGTDLKFKVNLRQTGARVKAIGFLYSY